MNEGTVVSEVNTFYTPKGEVPTDWATFESFSKIPRWKREIIITEKIDGTNAQIYVPEDGGPLQFGSRNRWVTPGADNAGFAAWGQAYEEQLRRLSYGRHYGEWWGPKIGRAYGLKERKFSLFNTMKWGGGLPEGLPSNIGVVPVLYVGMMSEAAIERALEDLSEQGSRVSPGFMRPEGIVIYHTASNTMFKCTIDNDDIPKEQAAARAAALERKVA